MPIYYQIDHQRQRIYTRGEGMITFDDIRKHIHAEEGSPAASYGEIFDCTDAETNITPEEIQRLADEREVIAGRREAAPVALIARNENLFEAFRLYDMLTEQIRPMQIFHNIEAAERWIDEVTRRWGNA